VTRRPGGVANLFDVVAPRSGELVESLVAAGGVRVERIVSCGHASPPGFWYDQAEHEWVVLLAGSAVLAFADGEEVALGPGDWIEIPAHRRHRVERTDPGRETVWLAVFWK